MFPLAQVFASVLPHINTPRQDTNISNRWTILDDKLSVLKWRLWLTRKFFHHQIVENLPSNATESKISQNVRFLNFFENGFFIWNGFFGKKTWFFSKLLNVPILLQNAYQMVLFLGNVFSTINMRFFGEKSKTKIMMKNGCFFRKKNV